MNDTSTRSFLRQILDEASQRHTKRLLDAADASRTAIREAYEQNRSILENRLIDLMGIVFISHGHFEQSEEMSPDAVFVITEGGVKAYVWIEQLGTVLWLYVQSDSYEKHLYIPDSPDSTFRDEVLHSILSALIDAIPF